MKGIFRGRKPVYRANGGYGTGTGLPGEIAQGMIEDQQNTGTPILDTSGSIDDTISSQIDWAADPRNNPQYYTGNTVAGHTGDDLLGREGIRGAADQMSELNQDLLGTWQDRADPQGEYANQLADASIAGTNRAWGSTGTLGSARNANAATQGAQRVVAENTANALQQIRAIKGDLTKPADLLNTLGKDERKLTQDVINADVRRFNYAQLSPQQQVDRILSLMTTRAGIEEGNVSAAPGQDAGATDWFNLLSGAGGGGGNPFSKLFSNEGGPVYRQDGGMMEEGMPMEEEGMMPQGEGIMNPEAGMEAPMDPMAMEDGAMPPMEAPMGNGIMGDMSSEMPMEDPMANMSELDVIENQLQSAIQAGGLGIVMTRKTKSKPKGRK